jgi:flavin-dependent dehydrogenase
VNDVVVIGAGPSGAAYALAAVTQGASVLLLGPPPRHPPHTLELLSARARNVLERLGIFELVTSEAIRCAGLIVNWGAAGLVDRPTILDPSGGGWIVDRAVFDESLLAAAAQAGVGRCESAVRAVEPTSGGWYVRLMPFVQSTSDKARSTTRERWFTCARLVLATGRTSRFVSRCGVPRAILHPLVSIVAWVDSPWTDLGERLRIEAANDMWCWALGRGSGTSLGFCTDLDLLQPASDRVAAAWATALRRVGWATDRASQPRLRLAFTGILTGAVPNRMDVVGDAALAVDPLSGHGLTLALESAWQSATNPVDYSEWLAQVTAEHLAQERAVYADARLTGPFWRRRFV